MSARLEFNDSEYSLQISTHTPPSPSLSHRPLVSCSPPLDMESIEMMLSKQIKHIHLACFGLFMITEIAFSAVHKVDTSHLTKMLHYDMLLSSTLLIVYNIVSGMNIKQKYRKAATSDPWIYHSTRMLLVNTSSTDSQMHNNIMAAGSKDRPPMLGPGRYSQWRSRFLRYIDTKPNGEGLRKSILSGPYVPSTVLVQAVAATEDGESMESYYSRFYKLMNELTRNNLQVTTMQVNVQFLQQLQPEWSRFVTVVKQSKEIDTISYHTLFDILKQYQNEVNDIRAERIAKSANPLALLVAA
ncbi:hypothetical protein Tco_0820589 [Tanacetum coccineum]|uniref:Gag-Pol polyprotein n=1 Tax=Tanacetum coccineum TaxID=301880 RepID=A0ABQ5A9U8_9ASTR